MSLENSDMPSAHRTQCDGLGNRRFKSSWKKEIIPKTSRKYVVDVLV